jgi:uncharacterized glyoxalase superfamily protein PhnB
MRGANARGKSGPGWDRADMSARDRAFMWRRSLRRATVRAWLSPLTPGPRRFQVKRHPSHRGTGIGASDFVLRGHHPEEAPTWCELARDGTVLQFLSGETPWSDAPSFTGCFYVHCSDVEAVYEQIRDLVEIEWGVEDREWGARELVLRDPDGYFLTFTQPA